MESTSGTVLRIASEQHGEVLLYKIILQEELETIYLLPYDLSEELALTHEGDRVQIEYTMDDTGILYASKFDNLEFEQNGQ